MIHEAWFVLHGGHAQLTLLDYLARVLLYLLAGTAVAVGVRACLGVVGALT